MTTAPMPDEIAGDAEHEAQEIEQTDMDSVPTVGFKKSFGSSELFGRSWFWCQFKKPRSYKKKTPAPEWTRSNVEIKKLVEHAFPNWRSNPSEHFYAARWIATIYWHYRQGYTCSQIAHELGSTSLKIRGVMRSIRRAARGLRANGKGPRTYNRGKNPLSRRKSKKSQQI